MPSPPARVRGPLAGMVRYGRDAVARGCAQAPVLGVVAGAAGAVQLTFLAVLMDPGPASAGAAAMLVLFLLFLVLFHFGLLLAGNIALEAFLPGGRGGRLLDGVKAFGLAAGTALMAVSAFKFTRTGAPLRASDLWFLWRNARQIAREGTTGEAVLWALFPAIVLAAAGLLWWGLSGARRRKRPALRPLAAGALAALALAGLAATPPGPSVLGSPLTAFTRTPALAFQSYAGVAGVRITPRLGRVDPEWAMGSRLGPYAPPPAPGRLNLVLVMLEAVPWNAAGYNGGTARMTPRLDALARESVVFARPYAASSQSHYSQMAILSSLFPHKFAGHDFYSDLAYPRALLWDALRPAGYATSMFSCQNEWWGNMIRYLRTPGLEVFRHCRDWPGAPHREDDAKTKVWEETVVDAWTQWLGAETRRPFFTYLNFQATHFPYEIPPGAPEPYAPSAIDFPCSYAGYPASKVPLMRNRFNNALRYSDAWLGTVVDRLQAAGEWDRTVLAVVSDHGEAFLEHGRVCHGGDLHEEQLRTLLLVRVPGMAGRRVEEPVSHLDLAPALLRLLDLPPHPNFQGRGDILDLGYRAAGRPLFFTLQGLVAWDGMLLDGWKYAVHWDLGTQRLYDLAADPGELEDRSSGSLRLGDMERRLRGFLEVQETYYEGRLWERGAFPPPVP